MDILEHGEELLAYLEPASYTEFLNDRRLRLITERLMEIIGEAAGYLSEETREQIPYDWKAVRGLRKILTHQYGSVDPVALHASATRDLPELLEAIRATVQTEGRDP